MIKILRKDPCNSTVLRKAEILSSEEYSNIVKKKSQLVQTPAILPIVFIQHGDSGDLQKITLA